MYVNEDYMKPRQDRGNPLENIKSPSKTSYSGLISSNHATPWKPITSRTMGHLAAGGKIAPQQIGRAIKAKTFDPLKFKEAFWLNIDLRRPTQEHMNAINKFAHLVF